MKLRTKDQRKNFVLKIIAALMVIFFLSCFISVLGLKIFLIGALTFLAVVLFFTAIVIVTLFWVYGGAE